MKFYTRSTDLDLFDKEHTNLLILVSLNVTLRRAGHIRAIGATNYNPTGWIHEADDYFHLYAALKHGFAPIPITDEEYLQLKRDGVAFLSRERTTQLREIVLRLPERRNR
jgi:hypothetical protein